MPLTLRGRTVIGAPAALSADKKPADRPDVAPARERIKRPLVSSSHAEDYYPVRKGRRVRPL